MCVGGSYIGCEVAASLTELGLEVTVLLQEDDPLAHHFGPAAGRRVRAVLEAHGVEVAGGETVDRFEGDERVARRPHGLGAAAWRPTSSSAGWARSPT